MGAAADSQEEGPQVDGKSAPKHSQFSMSWVTQTLNPIEQSLKQIETAVRNAEKKTSAEIVPVLVRRSTDRASVWRTSWLITWVLLLLLGSWFQIGSDEPHSILANLIDTEIEFKWSWWVTISFLVSSFFGWLVSDTSIGIRLFSLSSELDRSAQSRALVELYEASKETPDHDSSAVIVFVSLLEHRALILAEHSALSKLPPEVWQDDLSKLLSAIRRHQLAKGFTDCIEAIAEQLSRELPETNTKPQNPLDNPKEGQRATPSSLSHTPNRISDKLVVSDT